MKTRNLYRIFFVLTGLVFVLTQMIGNAKASPRLQAEMDFTAIDTYLTEQMNKLDIPGLALGIVQDGQIVHLQGFGTADSSGRAVTPQTPFHIGSLTKSFTALAIMQLVEAGKVELDAPVQTYLPWFELADKKASSQITVRHLLNQTTGISTKDGNRFWASQLGLEEYLRGLDHIQLTYPVGTTYQYCNINFMIAGLIIEKVSGQSYADYITEQIFTPLNMNHSYTSRAAARADGLAEGHLYMFGRVFANEGVEPPAGLPAGFLLASAEDMTHYLMAQLNHGRYGDTAILSPQGMNELHDPAIPDGEGHYAMGWTVGKRDTITFISHTGDTGRNHAFVSFIPERGLGVVLLTNSTGFEQVAQIDDLARSIVINILDSTPLALAELPLGIRFQYWAIVVTPLLQILGIVLVWRQRKRIKAWGAILIVILNLALVFILFRLSLQIITLRSMLVFFPDLGYSLVAIAALGIGWSVVYTSFYLGTRKEQFDLESGNG